MPNRHHADVFVYVLEGTVVMQVAGGEEMTLTAGQTFYESPADIHAVSRNASDTEPAKIPRQGAGSSSDVAGRIAASRRFIGRRVRDAATLDTPSRSEPHVAHAFSVARQVIERIQAVEVIDGQVGYSLWIREPDVDGHPPPSVLVDA